MKIKIENIKNKPYLLNVNEPFDRFPVLQDIQTAGECSFKGNVSAEISVEREHDHLKVLGRVQVPVELICCRCLVQYPLTIESSFTIIFRKECSRQGEIEDETELCDEDLISSSYSGDEIDFAHEIEEQVAMVIPFKPLCDDDCKGLCSSCGVDLNTTRCSCSKEPVNLKFNALKDFKIS